MNISKEAIEAAARAVYGLDPWEDGSSVSAPPFAWAALGADDRRNYYPAARAILEAAAPLLMAQAWDEGRAHGAMWPYGYRGLATDDNPYRKEADHE